MDEEENTQIFKVVLIGEIGVGKSSIINKFINDKFNIEYKTTYVPQNFEKKIYLKEYDNQLVTLEIWDTVGQEKYRSVTEIFYKNADAAILVYDITKSNSYKSIQNYWIKELREKGPDYISKLHNFIIFI